MNIVLIGFMGAGKSSVAKHLSHLLGYSLAEMDELVYQKTGMQTMHEVFAKGGELLLREVEIEIAKEYSLKKNYVISTGGGVIQNKIILDYFKKEGAKIIFLKASFEEIEKRLEGDCSRPLFAKKLYDLRNPLYAAYADIEIDTESRSPQEIAHAIQGACDGL